jgi:hypothetical protein
MAFLPFVRGQGADDSQFIDLDADNDLGPEVDVLGIAANGLRSFS